MPFLLIMREPRCLVKLSNKGLQPYRLSVLSTTQYVAIKGRLGRIEIFPDISINPDEIVIPPTREIKLWPCDPRPIETGQGFPASKGEIQYLACSNSRLVHLSVMGGLSIHDINCSHNNIRRLSFPSDGQNSGAFGIVSLNCAENLLTSLDVSQLRKLRTLNCAHNRLSALVLGQMAELRHLDCAENSLKAIAVKKLRQLHYFNVTNNPLIHRHD